ncbi:peptidase S41 [Anoxybacterium hadale]|uniref:Peptidase S41 n=1 Tax=Anoxybacterium hadale TaxID=3408580 RepID=A0ACD1A638_9FIRM|nr:peptidase S41 [Clostridiales bacterium]
MKKKADQKWLEVLDFLQYELPKRHKNLYFQMNESNYLKKIQSLRNELNRLEPPMITAEIAKIVASIGDAHTSIDIPVYYLCPLEFYWFSDGICVINTAKTDEILRYKRITHIDGVEIETVIAIMSTMISHENHSYRKAMLPKYLPAIEYLYGLKLARSVNGFTLTYENESGEGGDWFVPSCPLSQYQSQLNENRAAFPADKLPLFRKNPDRYYWMEFLKKSRTLYFKYNICKEMSEESVQSFGERLLDAVRENKLEKLVIDMRNNTGGNSTLLDPFIDALSKCDQINQQGRLFVIIGRDTFSSALLNVFSLKNKTNALLVGEPTGGKPNCYGEVLRVKLEQSGLRISYSTKYYHLIEDDHMLSLNPDVQREESIQDYIGLSDPCMEYILLSS